MRGLRNIYNLGVKELRSLLGDKAMLALIVFAFTVSVYSSATVMPGSLRIHAARKYAAAGTGYYVDHADHPLRQPGAGDIVSRRQLRHRLAAVLNLAGYRRSVLYYRVAAFS